MCKALNPDVYLIQEWDRERVEEQDVAAWFKTYVDPSRDWSVAVSGNAEYWSGTLVVTHHPIQARGPRVSPLSAGGWGFPIRFAAALIETPIGTLLAGSVHLKASGALETLEDERRFAEAEAVHHMMSAMKSVAKPELVVLGGDFNLNGDSDILRKATLHLDADSSALTPAEAQVLGDTSLLYTFGRSGLRSRLDFITYPDSIAEPVNAFVLDTAIWDDASLSQAGLQKADSEATDHLPVVVDLKFKAR
jgi:endonuclease/exonuclease/phosphatase family metal-dependent hydrolase